MTPTMSIEDCLQKTHAVWLFLTVDQLKYYARKGWIGKAKRINRKKIKYVIEVDKFVTFIHRYYNIDL